MKVHHSNDQNGPNRRTISNIINRTVEYDLIEIRTKQELEFWKSESSCKSIGQTITLET